MRLSNYFTLDEMTASDTASRHGIDNVPGTDEMVNLRHLCETILDPLRELAGAPIVISSGYRSPRVNTRIGGSKTSQHCKGEAADIKCPAIGNQKLYDLIVGSGLKFDQLIQEFWTADGGGWIHISYTHRRQNRGQVLVARKVNGKTTYSPVK